MPDHLDRIDDLYEEYKATVEEQRLTFEQSMLCDYLIKSLPDAYYLPLRQTFRGKSSKDKEINRITFPNHLEVGNGYQPCLIPAAHYTFYHIPPSTPNVCHQT